jgi:hypothetical protein
MRQIRKEKITTTLKYILLSIPLFFCFVTIGYTKDATLMWSANTESDLDGYKVYYKSGSSGHPYNGMGAMEGDSPITIPLQEMDNPEQPEYTIHDLDDFEDYYFVLTAYDIYERESGYSNEVDTVKYSSSSGGCFIATEAYGYPIEPYVNVLREFRDRFLLANRVGKIFMDFYYTYSPPIADFIANNDGLRAIAHAILLPVVGVSWVALKLGPVFTMAFMIFFGISLICFVGFRRKFQK